MKIYKTCDVSGNTDYSYVYRVCVLRNNPVTGIPEVTSLYSPKVTTPIELGMPLKGSFHAGTKAKFCLAYYTGMDDLAAGETEVLLTLKVPSSSVISPEDDAYMGSEVIITNPIVVKIETVSDAENNPKYQ